MMKKYLNLLIAAIVVVMATSCHDNDYQSLPSTNPATDPEETSLPSNIDKFLPALEEKCQTVLNAAYMAETDLGENKSVPGWEGYPVHLYSYHVTDGVTGERKNAKVYMLNPDAKKLAMWVATAAWKAKRSLDTKYTDKICEQILYQSGGQFPVLGMVYEDMDGEGQFAYLFKDGVTVYPADDNKKIGYLVPTDDMINYYINITNAQLKNYTGRYARICSTTREQYTAMGGTEDVGTSDSQETRNLHWLDVVRDLYQKAWDSNYNELIIAWANDNL
ncbi:MAG: cellulase [Muribaculaceae bacterium]|nr:cellulase [Muribaculaceae bacterium]